VRQPNSSFQDKIALNFTYIFHAARKYYPIIHDGGIEFFGLGGGSISYKDHSKMWVMTQPPSAASASTTASYQSLLLGTDTTV